MYEENFASLKKEIAALKEDKKLLEEQSLTF